MGKKKKAALKGQSKSEAEKYDQVSLHLRRCICRRGGIEEAMGALFFMRNSLR